MLKDVTGQSAQIISENAVSITAGGKVELGTVKLLQMALVYRHKNLAY